MKKILSMLLTAALTIGVFTLSGCSSARVIDFKEYTKITCEGGNGSGYINVSIDYEAIAAMLGEQNTFSVLSTLNSFKAPQPENNGTFSNGDKVKIKINYNENVLKEANLAVENTEFEYEVSGLSEKEKVDIFKDVEIRVTPSNGDTTRCKVYASYNGDVYSNWTTNDFNVTDTDGILQDYYAEGDKILVSLSKSGLAFFNSSKNSRTYELERTSAEFTVTIEDKEEDKN